MNAAEQAQGVEETRESHALKLLSQIEARKNRLKQENMALVFPEPEKLAAIEARRAEVATRAAALDRSHADAEARLPVLEEERRSATTRLQEALRELATLEAALQYGIRLRRGRVFADLWDLEKFSVCAICFEQRRARLREMNLGQVPGPPIVCECCPP